MTVSEHQIQRSLNSRTRLLLVIKETLKACANIHGVILASHHWLWILLPIVVNMNVIHRGLPTPELMLFIFRWFIRHNLNRKLQTANLSSMFLLAGVIKRVRLVILARINSDGWWLMCCIVALQTLNHCKNNIHLVRSCS